MNLRHFDLLEKSCSNKKKNENIKKAELKVKKLVKNTISLSSVTNSANLMQNNLRDIENEDDKDMYQRIKESKDMLNNLLIIDK